MIKNNFQLRKAQARLEFLSRKVQEYNHQFSGIEREIHVVPFEDEIKQINILIDEYINLRDSPFDECVQRLSAQPILLDNISELLSKLRIAAKLSQEMLAEKMDWDQPNLSRFESENYNAQTIKKIAEYTSALNVYLHVIPSLTEYLPQVVNLRGAVSNLAGYVVTDETNEGDWINNSGIYYSHVSEGTGSVVPQNENALVTV